MNRSVRSLAVGAAVIVLVVAGIGAAVRLRGGDSAPPATSPTDNPIGGDVDVGASPSAAGSAAAAAQVPKASWVEITPPISLEFADFDNMNYGAQTIALSPSDPHIVYLGTCYQGIWRTVDEGATWTRINTGRNGANLDTGRNWTLAVDPTDPDILYTTAGFGFEQGVWKSVNGGVDWDQILTEKLMAELTPDVYSVTINPDDPLHLLIGFHSGWGGGPTSGLLESRDGGASWLTVEPQSSWGTGHYAFFVDATTWLLTTQYDGVWRTADSGATWEQVSSASMMHGANQMYRSTSGVLYLGAANTLLRSEDDGRSWEPVGPRSQDGYNAIIGNGEFLFALSANTGDNTVEDDPLWAISPEDDGRVWEPFDTGQHFSNGPMAMAFDADSGILYSSNWGAGVFRLDTR